MTSSSDQFLSTTDVASECGVTARTVARWVDAGMLAGVFTSGGHRRVRRVDLERFLSQRRSLKSTTSGDSQLRVLVISKDPAVGNMVAQGLRIVSLHGQLETAHDLLRAGVVLALHEHLVVFVEHGFGGQSGAELCRQITAAVPGRKIYIVGVTDGIEAGLRSSFLRAGASSVLAKPLKSSGCKAVLAEAGLALGLTDGRVT